MDMQKKTYTPPTVTQHGDAIKQTNGVGGKLFEMIGTRGTETKD